MQFFFAKQCHSSKKRESMHGNLKNNSVASYMLYITHDFQIVMDLIFKMTDYDSAVARGGAGGARAPPVFFLKSKNRPV